MKNDQTTLRPPTYTHSSDLWVVHFEVTFQIHLEIGIGPYNGLHTIKEPEDASNTQTVNTPCTNTNYKCQET